MTRYFTNTEPDFYWTSEVRHEVSMWKTSKMYKNVHFSTPYSLIRNQASQIADIFRLNQLRMYIFCAYFIVIFSV